MNGVGQDFSGAERVVVLIEKDGLQHGWEVLQPQTVRWDFADLGPQGTQAKVTVQGVFHRMSRLAPEWEALPSTPDTARVIEMIPAPPESRDLEW